MNKILLKAAVLCSSLLLMAGFVSYRAGAFDRWMEPDLTTPTFEDAGEVPDDMFYTSKSGAIFVDDAPHVEKTVTKEESDVIMSGTKVLLPVHTSPEDLKRALRNLESEEEVRKRAERNRAAAGAK